MKIPYSFKVTPGTGSDACIQLRTVQSLALPGEQTKEIYLQAGDTVRFTTTLAVIRHFIVDGKKRQITPSPVELEDYIHARLAKAGFSVQSLMAGKTENAIVRKNASVNASPILIPISAIRATCIVSQAGEAEKALVYGIGRKRVFGFGFLKPFSVNDDDESF
ncbi:type I-E CRISPR-associated protein Cas6/Cse3/CasE [Salmonella enterica]|nr:type I-E CRISPR-associated protein Cas6/Cse3/CasE [Salmonella enterica]EEQ0799889.1 type I-E CRISPR-associated protein Cas6/Cse3/CasE [Salmonella enterica subsp. enterica serovar Lattenkamp]EEP5145178.1 type I-E CRISPR-associated protein Cas6/Cse3/CasE [Salmonella enterica]EFP0908941.1 type I-E CRISPR-associated protein Cas6/Cse3/CasE [Salmonella enterica]EFR2612051.1 type I-E CRISPR-associated protein Cas6/Cse3/CasE [Salmonella enterica]